MYLGTRPLNFVTKSFLDCNFNIKSTKWIYFPEYKVNEKNDLQNDKDSPWHIVQLSLLIAFGRGVISLETSLKKHVSNVTTSHGFLNIVLE